MWCEAEITNIFHDKEGDWFTVKYYANGTWGTKQIQRYNPHIKPSEQSTYLLLKEKIPFIGWKKLVSGQLASCISSDEMKRASPQPYQLEQHEPTQIILTRYLKGIKHFNGIEKELYDNNLPSIAEVHKEERETIFVQKLYLCQAKCNFFDTSDQMIELIEKKERMLLELSEFIYIYARHVWFTESLYEKCLVTISHNLFRSLSYQDRPPVLFFEQDKDNLLKVDEVFDNKDTNFEDPAWRHLKLVYDFTWRVINTPQVTASMMKKHMTGKFLRNLIELFASEDHRERAYLMMILHKIYGRCLKLRPYIIEIMSSYFYRMIYSDEFQHVNGISELLQILCAIISGLAVPVKDSWQCLLRNILVPLHKCRELKKFWEQLTQCCVNYVAKDKESGAVILGGLLKFWPQQSTQKEEIFIMSVVNIINVLITHQHGFIYENYKCVLVCAASKLAQCMLSMRQSVAERAISAWKEECMQRLVDFDRKAFLPILCESFYRIRENHSVELEKITAVEIVEKVYSSKDSTYWKKMQHYLAKKDKKETAIANALQDAQAKNKDPYDIVKAKLAKYFEKHKRAKPLTIAEKNAKRQHFWREVERVAKQKKTKAKQKWKYKKIQKWTNEDVLSWINSMGLAWKWQRKIRGVIKSCECTGKDIAVLKNAQDVGDSFDINENKSLCVNILNEIKKFKAKHGDDNSSSNGKFKINIFSQEKYITLDRKVTKYAKIKYIKELYKKQSGVSAKLDDIHFYSHQQLLPDYKTLEQMKIVDDKHLITVKFGTYGGAAYVVYHEY